MIVRCYTASIKFGDIYLIAIWPSWDTYSGSGSDAIEPHRRFVAHQMRTIIRKGNRGLDPDRPGWSWRRLEGAHRHTISAFRAVGVQACTICRITIAPIVR